MTATLIQGIISNLLTRQHNWLTKTIQLELVRGLSVLKNLILLYKKVPVLVSMTIYLPHYYYLFLDKENEKKTGSFRKKRNSDLIIKVVEVYYLMFSAKDQNKVQLLTRTFWVTN